MVVLERPSNRQRDGGTCGERETDVSRTSAMTEVRIDNAAPSIRSANASLWSAQADGTGVAFLTRCRLSRRKSEQRMDVDRHIDVLVLHL